MATITNISISGSSLQINYKGGSPPAPEETWDGWTTTTDDPAESKLPSITNSSDIYVISLITNPSKRLNYFSCVFSSSTSSV